MRGFPWDKTSYCMYGSCANQPTNALVHWLHSLSEASHALTTGKWCKLIIARHRPTADASVIPAMRRMSLRRYRDGICFCLCLRGKIRDMSGNGPMRPGIISCCPYLVFLGIKTTASSHGDAYALPCGRQKFPLLSVPNMRSLKLAKKVIGGQLGIKVCLQVSVSCCFPTRPSSRRTWKFPSLSRARLAMPFECDLWLSDEL